MKTPLSIVIPLRDRYGARVRNCLRGIELQTQKGVETIVVDYGSTPENHMKLLKTLKPFRCRLYYCKTKEYWSPAISKNIGLRRSEGEYVATLDVDCILEPNVVESLLSLHGDNSKSFVISRLGYLPEMDLGKINLPEDYPRLRRICKPTRPRYGGKGYGSLMSVKRSWWFKVRGCDERMKAWGANDDDIRERAIRDGLKALTLEKMGINGTMLFHQWHPDSRKAHIAKLGEKEYRRIYKENVRILRKEKSMVRNDENWGLFVGGVESLNPANMVLQRDGV